MRWVVHLVPWSSCRGMVGRGVGHSRGRLPPGRGRRACLAVGVGRLQLALLLHLAARDVVGRELAPRAWRRIVGVVAWAAAPRGLPKNVR